VARGVGVESAVLVEQVVLRQEAGVDVAAPQIHRSDALVVDVHELFASGFAQGVLVDEQVAVGEDDVTPRERAMPAGFAEEDA